MKILVNCLGYDSGKSGISSYMRNVLKRMRGLDCDITLLLERDAAPDFKDFDAIVLPKFLSKGVFSYAASIFLSPFFARKFDCQLVLAGNRRVAPFGKTPKVGVIHDLSQYGVKDKYGPLRMFQLFKVQPVLVSTFDLMAAISLSTKNDIVKYWKFPTEKIALNYNGVCENAEPDNSVFERLGLEKYILYVSRIEHPGKNHCALIEAFEKLPRELGEQYKLVLAGADWNGSDAVKARAAQSPLAKNIIFTGFISNAELSALYSRASAFVFASLAEGFGLGLVEAMQNSVPCAASNIPSLREIGEGAALFFDPRKPEEMAEAVGKILSDSELAASLAQKGRERAKKFSWEDHAKTLLRLCREADAKNRRVEIFGIGFYNGRMGEISKELARRAKEKIKTSVAFINTHYLNCAYEDAAQRVRLGGFDFVLPDGSGVSLACKILGKKYKDNLNGTDLLPRLCALAQAESLSMFFLGGKEGVAKRAAQNLQKAYPNLKIAGTLNGYFENSEDAVKAINDSKADILFVGLGAVLQEKWLSENFGKLNCPLALAAGGICDVYSGDLKRNPVLRKLGLEWFGRLLQEPKRLFGRYVIGNPLFVARVFGYKFFGKCGRDNQGKGA
ncbi:MAG: WecB/TagA/CpsF family glycosyltransferase [Opitutales bacterium]|nr:WecB/TagA/CpsF family glycosyltransferase [Opitutales bacterium]